MAKPLRLSDIPIEDTRSPEPDGPPLRWAVSKNKAERAAWSKFWLWQPFLGTLNLIMHHAFRLLSVSACSNCGAALAPFIQNHLKNRIFAKRIEANIKRLRPDASQDPEKAKQMLASWWQNVGRVYAEFSVTDRHLPQGHVEVSGADHLDPIRANGQHIIFCSVHIGHWEAQAEIVAQVLDVDMTGPFQPEPNRFTNRLVYEDRKRRGRRYFPPGRKSALTLRRVFETGKVDGIFYLDDVRDAQVHMPLFGRPTPDKGNAVSAIKLAMATGAALVPVFLIRKQGADYQLKFLDPVEYLNTGDRSADQSAVLKALNEKIEPVVLEHLDQWYMLPNLRL